MFLTYHPEGQEEPTRWRFNPNRGLLSVEREDIERRTGLSYAKFVQGVIEGSSICRRALLFVYLRRDHQKTRWEDIEFEWEEVKLEHSRQEYLEMRQKGLEKLHGDELASFLSDIDREIEKAFDDVEESGKAKQPTAD